MDRPTALHKAILVSLLFASVIVPVRAARAKKLRRGRNEALVLFALFAVGYVVATLLTAPTG